MATKIRYYFDEHASRSLERALIERGYEVLMAVDEGMTAKDDDTEHLPFATARGLVVFTRDLPFAGRTARRTDHAGLVCWTGAQQDVGGMVRVLSEFAERYTPEEVMGKVFWFK